MKQEYFDLLSLYAYTDYPKNTIFLYLDSLRSPLEDKN